MSGDVPEGCLVQLDELCDTLSSLPHAVARLLAQLRETEAVSARHADALAGLVAALDPARVASADELRPVEAALAASIAAADEKVSLAGVLQQTVAAHVLRVEDDVLAFEREVAVARRNGLLAAEEGAFLAELERAEQSDEEASEGEGGAEETKDSAPSPKTDPPSPRAAPAADGAGAKRRRASSTASERGAEADDGKRSRRSSRAEPSPPASSVASVASPPAASDTAYCVCRKESFGEMVACDSRECAGEWFHYGCVGLSSPPAGKWFCPDCSARNAKRGRSF